MAILATALTTICSCSKPPQESKRTPPKYPVFSADILQAIPDGELEYAIVDHVSCKITNYENPLPVLTNLSKGMQMVYSTWWVDAEVNNGGFNQFYWNSSGKLKNIALEGFKILGAEEHYKLMAEANQIQEQQESRTGKLRQNGSLKDLSKSYKNNPLNALDTRFYELKENVGARRIKYIREHVEEFVTK
jgi:hypothetical protein